MKKQDSFSFTNYLSILFNHLTKSDNKVSPQITTSGIILTNEGIVPHQNNTTFYLTKDTITAPITIKYTADHHDFYTNDQLLSSSNESLESLSSSSSTSSSSDYHHRNSISSITLSEILCDHYVNQHYRDEENQEVPLETYKVFEASYHHRPLNYDDDESWFIWDVLQKEKVWIEQRQEEKVTIDVPVSRTMNRSIRANSAHLRMIVAEVNMMRANKIVCPLRPRSSLPPRNDPFYPRLPSPLGTSL